MPPLYVDHRCDAVYVLAHEPSLDTSTIPPEFASAGLGAGNPDLPREINLVEAPSGNDQTEHDVVPELADRQRRDTLHLEHEDQQQETIRDATLLHIVPPPPYEST